MDEADLINVNASDLLKLSQAQNKKSEPSNNTILIKNETLNIMALVELLSLCCEGKSDKAEEKCQKELLTLENATTIIKACGDFWPLKRSIVNYVWQCFLDSNSKSIFIEPYHVNIDYIWEIAEVLLADAAAIIGDMGKLIDN